MSGATGLRLAAGSAAIALATASGAASALSDAQDQPVLLGAVSIVAGLAFVGSGLTAWARRPLNGTGRLLVLVGLALLGLSALWAAGNSLLFTLGAALGGVYIAVFLHLLVAYPQGRLRTRAERVFVSSVYALALLAGLLPVFFEPDLDCGGSRCPRNAFLLAELPGLATAVEDAATALGVVVFLGLFTVLVRRWRAASPAARRQLSPVYLSGCAAAALIGVGFVASFASSMASSVAWLIAIAAFIALPFLFLGGLLRSRLARVAAARMLLETPDEPSLEEAEAAISRALGDPTLRLLEWDGEKGCYVDVQGACLSEPRDAGGRAVTRIEYEDRPLAAIVHDVALREEPDLLEEVVATARLALEKDRGLRTLRRSEARSRALLDALPDLMIRFGRDGTYLDIEGDTSGLVRPPEELIGTNVWNMLPRDVVEPVMRCAERALETGAVQTIEYELELDGEIRVFEARMVPSGGDEIVSIVRDFTELRRLESELQARLAEIEREQQFVRTVVGTAPVIFLIVDLEGRIVQLNDTCQRLLGIREDERVKGRPFWEVFLAPDDVQRAKRLIAAVGKGEAQRDVELRWTTAAGRDLVVETSAERITDGQGQLRYLVCGLDVTERKRQEEELRRSRARIVEAGDAARRRLERNLHDGAQQRLVSLSLALRLAQARLGSDPKATNDILARASEELATALEELRELARGIHPAVLTDRGLLAALENLAERSPVPVELDGIPEERLPPTVEAAAFYVVSESLANVAKYARATHARVSVTRANGRAVVEVADDGVGGADPARGSGLRGLADRVEALDGRLDVDSPPGGGTHIRAEIPCG